MRTLIVGVGNPIRGDDGVGVHVLRALQERGLPPAVELLELGSAGLTLLDHLEGIERLVLVDAITSSSKPGTVFELDEEEAATTAHLSTGHEADLPSTLRVGRELMDFDMPAEVRVFAVEAAAMDQFSEELTPAVAEAVPVVVERIFALLHPRAVAG